MIAALLWAAAVAADAPPPIREERFLTLEEALRVVLPDAEEIQRRRVRLTPEEADRLRTDARTGSPVPLEYDLFIGRRNGTECGRAVVLDEIGRFHEITFIVGVDPQGRVRDVAVMTYREEIGSEVRYRMFLNQFRSRTARSPLRRNSDVINITGATMSVDAICRGVRKALRMVRVELPPDEPVTREHYVMGTLCRITAWATPQDVEAAFAEIRRWDRVLSIFDDASELARLNAAGGGETSPDLAGFLAACADAHRRTDGAFDPTVGPAVRAWGFLDRRHRVPDDAELEALRPRIGWNRITLEGRHVELPPGAEIDPGGIGKGWAVDRAIDVLRQRGVTRALVTFRSTAYALGAPPDSDGWTFQIEGTDRTVILHDGAISTSAITDNVFEADGRRLGHILDPRSLRPVGGLESVTVLAPTATLADGLSTGFFVLGPDEAFRRCGNGVEALFQLPEGQVRTSEHWPR